MAWRYKQSTGDLWRDDGDHHCVLEGRGYSGHGGGVNNPALQDARLVGPIPVGRWLIGKAADHPKLGPLAMPLFAAAGTQTFGRGGFFIHGDNVRLDESASEGCIILGRALRRAIAASGDAELEVIP